MDCRIGYVIVGVKALEPAIAFYPRHMGFEFLFSSPNSLRLVQGR
jgi:catechol 2,3-dioxygenase-like lactoylglutathione lyase family enzyme